MTQGASPGFESFDNDNDIDDLGYESEVYLDDDEDEDENNHSNRNVVKRGITRLSKFYREYGKPDGIKLSVTFDALNRISGKHRALFFSFLGDLVREHIGLKILSWKKEGEARDKLWDEITVKSAAAKMACSKFVYQHTMGRGGYAQVKEKMIKNKEIEPDEEPSCGILWLKGRENKDKEFPDDKIRLVGDKLKETEDKIKEGTLKVDHGTDAMTVVLGKEKGGYARGVSQVDINPINSSADEEGGTPVVGCENDASIQKSNGLATSEKEMETWELPKDCYKVSIDKSLVDAACIPDVGNNGFKTVKDVVGGFFSWPKNQVVLDPKGEVVYSTSLSMVFVKYYAYMRRIIADFLHVPPERISTKT
ncbi:hypothetical protein Tco_0608229 [Tanacetum coccineum]